MCFHSELNQRVTCNTFKFCRDTLWKRKKKRCWWINWTSSVIYSLRFVSSVILKKKKKTNKHFHSYTRTNIRTTVKEKKKKRKESNVVVQGMNSHLSHGFCRSCLLFLPRDVSSASCRIATVRGKKPVTNDCVFRSVTKEEKEKENTRKVAPVTAAMTMPPAGRPSSVQARPIHGILQDDSKAVCGSFRFSHANSVG